MKKRILKIIIIIVICLSLAGGASIIWQKHNNQIPKDAQELKAFDIEVDSWVNMMPMATPDGTDPGPKKALFLFTLKGIDMDDFLKNYEIESIMLNGNLINNKDIQFDNNSEFRFYSAKYKLTKRLDRKKKNKLLIVIKDKKTDEKYIKQMEVVTGTVY